MNRNNSIDNIRLLAIFGVIVLHNFSFFFVEGLRPLGIAVNQLTRFAVPCFFVISGYLYAQRVWSVGAAAALRKSAPRIVFLYFFWNLFYVLPYNFAIITADQPHAHIEFARAHLAMWTSTPENFLLGGAKGQLWFLSALFCATVLCTPFIAYRKFAQMLALTLGLYVAGLLADPYHDIFPGFSLPMSVRNGPLFSSLLFAIGAVLATVKDTRLFFRVGYVLTVLGAVLQLAEITILIRHGYQRDPLLPLFPDYLFSTVALGAGPAMIGISGAAARNNKPWLWGIGRYTLGIYALHLFVMDLFLPIRKTLATVLWWQLAGPLLFFALTALLVAGIARIPRLRPLIS